MVLHEGKTSAAFTVLARTLIADRKRRSPWLLLIAILVILGLIGLGLWAILRPGDHTPLLLAAFDAVAVEKCECNLVAQLEPIESAGTSSLGSQHLFFQDALSIDRAAKLATDRAGAAVFAVRPVTGSGIRQFIVRYPGEENRRRGAEAHCRIFSWPVDSSLLLVDADHGLAKGGSEEAWARQFMTALPADDAGTALQKTGRKFRVVYVSSLAASPGRYLKLRGWLERSRLSREGLPDGPLLVRPVKSDSGEETDSIKVIAADLRLRFNGDIRGVSSRLEVCGQFKEAGAKAVRLFNTDTNADGIECVESWGKLAEVLVK